MKSSKINKQIVGLTFLFVMLFSTISYAQDDTNDFASWNSIGLEYKPNKKWSFALEEQLRLKNNASDVDEYFTELGAEYEVFKNFELGGGLRYIKQNDNEGKIQGYEDHFRFNINASYKHKLNNFKLGYKLSYQNKNELGVSTADGDIAKETMRFKTSVDYNIKNWSLDPEFSAEIFNDIGSDGDNGFSKYRLTFGTDYKFKDFGKIGIFYRLEKELNVDLPETTNILGLKYTYTIKNKKN